MLRAFYMRHVCATYPASLAILDLIILMFCEEWNYDVPLCAVFLYCWYFHVLCLFADTFYHQSLLFSMSL